MTMANFMTMMRWPLCSFLALVGLDLIGGLVAADEPGVEAVRFFETKVRPVLAERCWTCHGPEKQSGGLRLDSRAGVIEGGASGPAIEPGRPEESLLLAAIRQNGEAPKMPPRGKGEKLDETAIAALSHWIELGAPWPASPTVAPTTEVAQASRHWAFQPVRKPEPPAVSGTSWVANPIDAFILAKLEARNLKPSPPADPRTLIRRLSFDLIGLPPSPDEVEAFVRAAERDRVAAISEAVDRLLASPHYGERWGRHWLDVARYADTKGYVFQEERRYPYSYTYRDWVINAFNQDLPFDQFVMRQIAADQLGGDDPSQLAALGFLTVGRRFLNNQDDIIDDRIDVTTRGFLGLTVACARCHDHKYDPIPAEDYYSLYGVFASCEEPKDLPLLRPSDEGGPGYQEERRKRQDEIDAFSRRKRDELQKELRSRVDVYLTAAFDLGFDRRHAQFDERARADKLRPELLRFLIEKWSERVQSSSADAVLQPWRAFAALKPDAFTSKAGEVADTLESGDPLVDAIVGSRPTAMRNVVEIYGQLLARCQNSDDPALDSLRRWIDAPGSPLLISADDTRRVFNREDRNKLTELQRRLDQVDVTHPEAPARAMVLSDRSQRFDPYVFLRGSRERRGPNVPRRFLKVLDSPSRTPFEHGSGRLDLARAIASPANPLTARVIVNRVWLHHFGEGLVRTPSDFGMRSDPPSHPELLDWLAATFVEEGWSLKRLHRLIVLSNAFQQQSGDRPDGQSRDPQNLLLWRQNRRRLELEPLRDAILAVSGQIDRRLGGRSVPITTAPYSRRRTVYAFVDRQNLDGLFRTFDFATPDASAPVRFETTVPQQALFLMNHPFVAEHARALIASLGAGSSEDRIKTLYARLFARAPEPQEIELGLRYVEEHERTRPPGDRLAPWEQYAQVLLLTNEFAFID